MLLIKKSHLIAEALSFCNTLGVTQPLYTVLLAFLPSNVQNQDRGKKICITLLYLHKGISCF